MKNNPPIWAWFLFSVPLLTWLIAHSLGTDKELFYTINQLSGIGSIYIWVFFNFLGNAWGVFAFSLPLLLYAPRLLISAIFAGIIAGIITRPIKEILQLPRPPSLFDHSTFFILGKPLTTLSMPSGHTVTAFAIATAYLFSLQKDRQHKFIWLIGLACITGMTRIVLGAHFPSDVFAGAAIGLFSGVLGSQMGNYVPDHLLTPTSWLSKLIVIGSVVCAYVLLTQKMDFEETYLYQVIAIAVILVTLIQFLSINLKKKINK